MINIQYNDKQKSTNLISISSDNMNVENTNIYAYNFDKFWSSCKTNLDPLYNTAGYDYCLLTIFHFEGNYVYRGFVGIGNQASSFF